HDICTGCFDLFQSICCPYRTVALPLVRFCEQCMRHYLSYRFSKALLFYSYKSSPKVGFSRTCHLPECQQCFINNNLCVARFPLRLPLSTSTAFVAHSLASLSPYCFHCF